MIVCEEGGSKTGEQRQTTLTSCLASVSRLGQADPSEAQLGLAADLLTVSFFQGQQRACPSHRNKKSAGKDQLCQRRVSSLCRRSTGKACLNSGQLRFKSKQEKTPREAVPFCAVDPAVEELTVTLPPSLGLYCDRRQGCGCSKETLVSLPVVSIRQLKRWSLRNWNFPGNHVQKGGEGGARQRESSSPGMRLRTAGSCQDHLGKRLGVGQ